MPARTKERIVYDGALTIPINTLKAHPQNPRMGDVEAVRESLRKNGQFRPVLVQKNSDTIIAGHHLWKAAKEERWNKIGYVYLDVDDSTARRILIADNRTADLGGYDEDILAQVLAEIGDPEGTGYSQEDFDLIIASETAGVAEAVAATSLTNKQGEDPGGLDDEDDSWQDDQTEEADEAVKGAFESAEEELSGVMQLAEAPTFDGIGYLQIPKLRPDMLVQSLPLDKLVTWSGSATRDWEDDDVWWFYNFGIDSTSGMKDVSRCLLSFYAYDNYFDNWWYYPERYIVKALNSRISMAVTPDFSMPGNEPRIVQLHQLYKSRWLGRYFQEVGIRIIPNIQWTYNDIDILEKHVLPGVPVGAPWIATGLVSFDADQTKAEFKKLSECFRMIIDVLKPENYFIYTNPAGRRFIEGLNLPVNIHFQPGRVEKLSDKAKMKEGRKTL